MVAILGYGKIGKAICRLLSKHGHNFTAHDISFGQDLSNINVIRNIVKDNSSIIATTPASLNLQIAQVCSEYKKPYFDLSENVSISNEIRKLSNQYNHTPIFPQCGLAPGITGLIAIDIAKTLGDSHIAASAGFEIETIEIQVGALPQVPENIMGYSITWSPEGLINEYINPCPEIINNELTLQEPLTDLKTEIINQTEYETFRTSGGLGDLPFVLIGKIKNLKYRTIRNPGHCSYINFLAKDLGLKQSVDMYEKLFDTYIPKTDLDMVLINIKINGNTHYARKILSTLELTAIQNVTACGVLAVWNVVMDMKQKPKTILDIPFYKIYSSPYYDCYK